MPKSEQQPIAFYQMAPEISELLSASGVPFKIHGHAPIISFEHAKKDLPSGLDRETVAASHMMDS